MPKRKSGDVPDSTEPKRLRTRAQHKKKKNQERKEKTKEKTPEKAKETATETMAGTSETSESAEASTSKATTPPRPDSPEPSCSICLSDTIENKSFTDSCFHTFCFVCLVEWSKVKAVCPLCKQPFKSIIHNVRTLDDYDRYDIPAEEPPAQRFRYRTTMTSQWESRRDDNNQGLSRPTRVSASIDWNRRRQVSTSAFRRRIYNLGMRVQEITTPAGQPVRYREISPAWFRRYPASTHRLVPWLNRELNVLLNNNDNQVTFVLELILDLIKRFDVQSRDFSEHLSSFLGRRTEHFVHEFYMFARSPSDIVNFDRHAIYHEPSTTDLLQLQATRLSSSSSDSGNDDDDDDVIILPGDNEPAQSYHSPARSDPQDSRPPRDPLSFSPLLRRVQDFLHDYTSGSRPWDSPTPGPSNFWSSSPFFAPLTSFSSVPTFDDLTAIHPYASGPSASRPSGSRSRPTATASRRSPSPLSSHESDIEVVGEEKPWTERSPIPVLSSDSEPEIVMDNSPKRHKNKKSKKKKKKHSKSKPGCSCDRSDNERGSRHRDLRKERRLRHSREERERRERRYLRRRSISPSMERHRHQSRDERSQSRHSKEKHNSNRHHRASRSSDSSPSSRHRRSRDKSSPSRSRSRSKHSKEKSSRRDKHKNRRAPFPELTSLLKSSIPMPVDEQTSPTDLRVVIRRDKDKAPSSKSHSEGGSSEQNDVISVDSGAAELSTNPEEGGHERRRSQSQDDPRSQSRSRSRSRSKSKKKKKRKKSSLSRTPPPERAGRYEENEGQSRRRKHKKKQRKSSREESEITLARRESRGSSVEVIFKKSHKQKRKKRTQSTENVDVVDLLSSSSEDESGGANNHEDRNREESAKQLWKKNATGHKKSSAKKSRDVNSTFSPAEQPNSSSVNLSGDTAGSPDAPNSSAVASTTAAQDQSQDVTQPLSINTNTPPVEIDLASPEKAPTSKLSPASVSSETSISSYHSDYSDPDARKKPNPLRRYYSGPVIDVDVATDLTVTSEQNNVTGSRANPVMVENQGAETLEPQASSSASTSKPPVRHVTLSSDDSDDGVEEVDAPVGKTKYSLNSAESGYNWKSSMREKWINTNNDFEEPEEKSPKTQALESTAQEREMRVSPLIIDQSSQSSQSEHSSVIDVCTSKSPVPKDTEVEETDAIDPDTKSFIEQLHEAMASTSSENSENASGNIVKDTEVESTNQDSTEVKEEAREFHPLIENVETCMESVKEETCDTQNEARGDSNDVSDTTRSNEDVQNVNSIASRTENMAYGDSAENSPRPFDMESLLKDFKPVIEDVKSCGESAMKEESQDSTASENQTDGVSSSATGSTAHGSQELTVKEELKEFNPVIDDVHSVNRSLDVQEDMGNVNEEQVGTSSQKDSSKTDAGTQAQGEKEEVFMDSVSEESGASCQKSPKSGDDIKSEMDMESFGILDVRSMDCDEFQKQSCSKDGTGDYVKQEIKEKERETCNNETGTSQEIEIDNEEQNTPQELAVAENHLDTPNVAVESESDKTMDNSNINQETEAIAKSSNPTELADIQESVESSIETHHGTDSNLDNLIGNTNLCGPPHKDIGSLYQDNIKDCNMTSDKTSTHEMEKTDPCTSSCGIESTLVCDNVKQEDNLKPEGSLVGSSGGIYQTVNEGGFETDSGSMAPSLLDSEAESGDHESLEKSVKDLSNHIDNLDDCRVDANEHVVNEGKNDDETETFDSADEGDDCESKTANETVAIEVIGCETKTDSNVSTNEPVANVVSDCETRPVANEHVASEMNDCEAESERPCNPQTETKLECRMQNGLESEHSPNGPVSESQNCATDDDIEKETKLENSSNVEKDRSGKVLDRTAVVDDEAHLSTKLLDLETPNILLPSSAFPENVA